MSRQSWNPDNATPAQLRLRAAVAKAAKKVEAAEADLYEAVRKAHEAGVPMDDLAEQAQQSRATLFRRIKPPQP
jgi:hypothetical protein